MREGARIGFQRGDGAAIPTVRASAGTVQLLTRSGRTSDSSSTCAYLLLGDSCGGGCGFCPLSGSSAEPRASGRVFVSRVTWPRMPRDLFLEGLVHAARDGRARRLCIQVTRRPEAERECLELLRLIGRLGLGIPVSACVPATTRRQVEELTATGAQRVGIPIDAATREVHAAVKGPGWDARMKLLQESAGAFPGRMSTHLIAGLGENEREALAFIQVAAKMGVTVALFSFTPIAGTRLSRRPAPQLESYRMVQLGRFLLSQGEAALEDFAFDARGRVIDLGLDPGEAGDLVCRTAGAPFRTSGCPDCNRPYFNESPRGPFRNYPRPLKAEEMELEAERVKRALAARRHGR